MSTAGEYDGWAYAPLRFAVWVLAFVYLGRIQYNNTLWDLRELTVTHVVVRTLSIAITLGFAYWNVFVVPRRIAVIMWATIALLVGGVLVWKVIVQTGVEYHDALDPLDRRQHSPDANTSLGTDRRIAGVQLGDVPDDN